MVTVGAAEPASSMGTPGAGEGVSVVAEAVFDGRLQAIVASNRITIPMIDFCIEHLRQRDNNVLYYLA
jgi:hypothetical protein